MEENLYIWMQSAQDVSHSLQNQLEKTSDKTINTVTNSLEKAQSLITAITVNTSGVIETAINRYINDFIIQYPIVLKTVKTLTWAISHPFVSAIILLLLIAVIWSTVKGTVRLIETASWSIFKIPVRLSKTLFLIVFKKAIQIIPLPKFNLGGLWKLTKNGEQTINSANFTTVPVNNISFQDKHDRLLAIYHRLELIHQEQQQLLKEAANLINSEHKNLLIDK